MGYTTDFTGAFACNPTLSPEHIAYLTAFSDTRRMRRDANKASIIPDPIREQAGLPIGVDGGNFVGKSKETMMWHDDDSAVTDYNNPPSGQPGLWCQWVPGDKGNSIKWDGNEKFYNYTEWLEYLINQYLIPWGYTLNGKVEWQGEEKDDIGIIEVKNNEVKSHKGKIVYPTYASQIKTYTPRQAELIKYALAFSLLNIDENWEDKFNTTSDVLEKELKELIEK